MTAAKIKLPAPPKDCGMMALLKTIRPLGTIASVMNSAVHPDDEQSSVLAKLSLGQGVDTVILNVTRGQGGQNAIGSEYHNALGVLRTMEMAQNVKVLHARNQWGRAEFDSPCMDFGFSKMWEEAEELWDFDYIADYLAFNIRRFRPQVCIHHAQNIREEHGQHQAMYMLFQMGIERAADAGRDYSGFPAWQVRKVYERCPQADQTLTVDIGAFDPWYGASFKQLGQYARSFHACQGMGGSPLPGLASAYFMMTKQGAQKIKNAKGETSFFEGLPYDFDGYGESLKDESVKKHLEAVQADYREVEAAFPRNSAVWHALHVMKADVKKALHEVDISAGMNEDEKHDVSFLLGRKLEQLDEALRAACALSLRIIMDEYEIVRGQEADIWVHIYQGALDALDLTDVTISLPDGWTVTRGERTGTLGNNQTAVQHFTIRADEKAELYNAFHGNVLTATASFVQGFTVSGAAENTFALLPDFSVEMQQKILALNTARESSSLKHSVKVTNLTHQQAEATVVLRVPEGWTVSPQKVQGSFAAREAKIIEFDVMPAQASLPGVYEVKGVVYGARENSLTVQRIVYPHIDTAFYLHEAVCKVQAFPLVLDEKMRIGYISSGLDSVGETLQMLGMDIVFLDEQDIRFDDLSQYHSILTGIRAYKHIKWLRGLNEKLLAYVKDGGNLVIQYHTAQDGYSPDLAPYPLIVGSPSLSWRVTREDSPVMHLLPEHPFLNTPNKLDKISWDDWVQERSLYIPMEWDSAYETPIKSGLVAQEGAEYEGQILTAAYGKGRFTYTSLVFFRQVPALVPGAISLLTNILSAQTHETTPAGLPKNPQAF
ncbi:MAG: PIG-L family deacetylase [Clostridiales bacterium]|nr:PIG-L family deacetylase [Clostridiales bacterium]